MTAQACSSVMGAEKLEMIRSSVRQPDASSSAPFQLLLLLLDPDAPAARPEGGAGGGGGLTDMIFVAMLASQLREGNFRHGTGSRFGWSLFCAENH